MEPADCSLHSAFDWATTQFTKEHALNCTGFVVVLEKKPPLRIKQRDRPILNIRFRTDSMRANGTEDFSVLLAEACRPVVLSALF